MSYIGKGLGQGVRNRYYFTATGGETSISGTDDGGNTLLFSDGTYVDVSLNGIALVAGTDYDTDTANTISNLDALTASDIVEVIVYDVFSVADSVSKSGGGTFDGAVTFNAGLTANTADINGGTVDGAVVGGTTPAAGTFTTLSATGNTTLDGAVTFQDAAILNSGTTAQRPASPATGSVRYNTDLELYEGYNGKEWTALSATKTPDIHVIDNSLRFNDDDSAYLSRTPASAGNQKTWTWAGWVKRGNLSSTYSYQMFSAATGNTNATYNALHFYNNSIRLQAYSIQYRTTSAVYRDTGAWMHVVCAVDTTQAVAANRIKLYVNGVEQTSFSASNDPALNFDFYINSANEHRLGSIQQDNEYADGYMSDVHFIDGQALAPTSFGEFDDNGVWNPIAYAGTYGTNGFHLEFETDSALGTDTSGNSNDWTPSGITTDDQVADTPSVNYATWNAVSIGADSTLSDGNLKIAYGTSVTRNCTTSTTGMQSGKWYWEIEITASSTVNTNAIIGISSSSSASALPNYPGFNALGWGYYGGDGDKYHNSSAASYGAAYGVGDVIGVSFDVDTGDLEFYKNNVSQGVAYTGLTDGPYFPAIGDGSATTTFTAVANFGQRPFAYTPPTGFQALNSANLPAPAITDGKEYFQPLLYTGNGATQSIGGLEFAPDLVWIKNRDDGTTQNLWYDTVRGATNALFSSSTSFEYSFSGLTSFDSAGFSVGSQTAGNGSGDGLVAWNWNAGGSTVTNTDGTITSQVRANTTAGISIVSYTGNGSAGATVGHGLATEPDMLIIKDRDATTDWPVYHSSVGATKFIELNTTSAAITNSTAWNNTEPTSSVFSMGTGTLMNASGDAYIAYCFAGVDGFSKFGSYTGNGSTDGSFVYTGFRPSWVMIKSTSTTGWAILDATRNTYNLSNSQLFAHASDAETTSPDYFVADFLSNGFKLRTTNTASNTNGQAYIYMAFAENPFKTARAR
jgi:hypothetical protein